MSMAFWMAAGVGIGALAGELWGNPPIGIAIGIAAAAVTGAIVSAIGKRRD